MEIWLIGFFILTIFCLNAFCGISDRRVLYPRSASSNRPCQPNDGFWFNKQPASIGVREGGRAFLECNVSDHCNIQFHWTLNDEPIANTTRRYQNGSNLVITRVNRTLDSGAFHCIATMATTGLARQSTPATLSIWWISSNVSVILVNPTLPTIESGKAKDVELQCRVEGYDNLQFTWRRNGRQLKSISGKLSVDKRRLWIQNVTTTDNGVYSCTVENSAGVVHSTRNFVLSVPGEGLPKLVNAPKDHIAKIGSSFTFDCQYKDAKRVMWTNAETGAVFTATGRIRQLENDSLYFSEVRAGDAGPYECVAFARTSSEMNPKNTNSQGYAAWLNVAKLDQFESSSFEPVKDIYVAGHGKPFEVACTPPAGYPEPVVYWTRNGERLPKSGRLRATDDHRLVIDTPRMEDQGEYECVAENLAGQQKGTIRLFISKPPTIGNHPSSLDAEEGAQANFECKYKGNEYPVTVVDWEVNGVPVHLSNDHRIKVFPHNSTLLIDSVAMTDAGDYVCVVRTGDQKPVLSKAGKLTVRERLKFTPKPVDRKIELNNSTQIPCRASGHIRPNVKWVQTGKISENGTMIKFPQPLTTFPDNIRDKNGTLYFHNTRFEDAGFYTCAAVSSQGVINETIKVEVFVYPTFKHAPRDEIMTERSDVWLHCMVDGTPKPTVQWFFNQVPETQWNKQIIDYVIHSNNTLQLKRVSREQAGSYTCLAGNRGGFKRQNAFVCVKLARSDYADCGKQLRLIQAAETRPGASLDERFRFALEEAKRRLQELGSGYLSSQTPHDSFVSSGSRLWTSGQEWETENTGVNGSTGREDAHNFPMTTIAIACGAAAAYLFLVIFLIVFCAYRRRKQRDSKPADAATAQLLQQYHQQIPLTVVGGELSNADFQTRPHHGDIRQVHCHSGHKYQALDNGDLVLDGVAATNGHLPTLPNASRGSSSPAGGINHASTPLMFHNSLQHLNWDDKSVLLGRGIYGDVYKTRLITRPRHQPSLITLSANSNKSSTAVSGCEEWFDVLVKVMSATNDWAKEEWEEEIKMYRRLDHPNIAKLLGVYADAEPVYAVMEYTTYDGNLKNLKDYLKCSKSSYYSKVHKGVNGVGVSGQCEYAPLLTDLQIIKISYQIAQGMEYLSDARCIHKDLAARNVLLSPQYSVKITQFSLSEEFANEYFTYQNRVIPVRWMPREALFEDEWSMKSDVWSFGVFIWELYTIGDLPHFTLSNDKVLDALQRDDLRLPPVPAPVVVQELISRCTSANPGQRPTFTETRELLGQLHGEITI